MRVSPMYPSPAHPWTVKLWKRKELLSWTTHQTEASRDIEVEVCRTRMRRGEASKTEVIDHQAGKTETLLS